MFLSSPQPASASDDEQREQVLRRIGPASWRETRVSGGGSPCLFVRLRSPLCCSLAAVRRRLRGRRARRRSPGAHAHRARRSPSQGEEAEGEEGETEEEREREEQEAAEAGGKDCSEVGDLDGEPEAPAARRRDDPRRRARLRVRGPVRQDRALLRRGRRRRRAICRETRDAAAKALEDVRLQVLTTDQEESTEAEAHLEGNEQTVDIQVITLCEGKLRIRYTVS